MAGRHEAPCRWCERPVRPCRCVAHDPPMWHHWPSGNHMCGDTTRHRAEPPPPGGNAPEGWVQDPLFGPGGQA